MERKAIIVGSNGQDGKLLANYLNSMGYELVLIDKGDIDIINPEEVARLILDASPSEVYFLAAYHQSSEDKRVKDHLLIKNSLEIHSLSLTYFLESIADYAPNTRFFYASSSHIFSDYGGVIQNEDTLVRPENIYAISKYSGMLICRFYREQRNIFASCGILYNHESNFRPRSFLSRKVAIAAAEISRQVSDSITLGDLDVAVDWGYAPDYVDAMHRILQLEKPFDYIVASGKAHTVRQLVDIAFSHVGLDYTNHIKIKSDLLNKEVVTRVGDARRLKEDTGWQPTISFEEMIKQMVDAELNQL